jgi:hypothetical protein
LLKIASFFYHLYNPIVPPLSIPAIFETIPPAVVVIIIIVIIVIIHLAACVTYSLGIADAPLLTAT